jgi:hypothetical protein
MTDAEKSSAVHRRAVELTALSDKYGGSVKPSQVVSFAEENKDSEWHASLEWDNEVAGHEYRLVQVRRLIRVTPIHSPDEGGKLQKVEVFHIPPSDGEKEGSYGPMKVLVASGAVERALEDVVRQHKALGVLLEKLLSAVRHDSPRAA